MTIPTAAQAGDMVSIGNQLVTTGNAILAALGTPPVTPPATPPAGDSPERTVINAPTGTITLAGHVWSWGAPNHGPGGTQIMRDSVPTSGDANRMTNVRGVLYVLAATGDWYKWDGSGWPFYGRTAP